jgi:hypothetical protein
MNKILSGTCTLDANNCALSTNYPQHYPINSKCTLELVGKITTYDLHSEKAYDTLKVNGKLYSGHSVVLPTSSTMTGVQEWTSDYSVTSKGFKICTDGGVVGPTLANKVISGPCSVDSSGCILSPNFPLKYGKNQKCELEMQGYVAQPWTFNTEAGYDFLEVGGKKYSGSGSNFPFSLELSGKQVFTSDYDVESTGFKICTGPSPSRLDEEDSGESEMMNRLQKMMPKALVRTVGMPAMLTIGACLSAFLMVLLINRAIRRRRHGQLYREALVEVEDEDAEESFE